MASSPEVGRAGGGGPHLSPEAEGSPGSGAEPFPAASPEVRSQTQAVYGSRNWSTRVYGQSHDYLQIRRWPLERGRMFTEEEVADAAMVTVFFGFYPAWKASRLDPIVALRRE